MRESHSGEQKSRKTTESRCRLRLRAKPQAATRSDVMRYLHLGMLFIFANSASAAEWPQWLGPNRDGSTSEKITPWKGELTPIWKKPVSEGNSSPVVVGGLVFLHT